MCVQPMKSIAAVALTDVAAGTSGSTATGLDAQSVTTAGILTGGAVASWRGLAPCIQRDTRYLTVELGWEL